LSEASMVNKMEYRVECQILSSLHAENRISARFPIGTHCGLWTVYYTVYCVLCTILCNVC
jgi:hypothetical protein